jgi:hypothetical protein
VTKTAITSPILGHARRARVRRAPFASYNDFPGSIAIRNRCAVATGRDIYRIIHRRDNGVSIVTTSARTGQASRRLDAECRGCSILVYALRLYWIRGFADGHLAIMPAPQPEGLERAVLHWKDEGVDIVVSLLERAEVPGLVEAEGELCDEIGLEFLWFPIRDGSVPVSASTFNGLIARLGEAVKMGKSVAIHCRAGIGRSALVAVGVLNYLNIGTEAALDMVAEARKLEVPQTEQQRQWILGFQPVRPT